MDLGQDNYTTPLAVQTYLNRTLYTAEMQALSTVIPAVSRWIDRAVGSCFDANPVPMARHFKGGYQIMNIDPCQNITLVQALNPYDNSVFYTYKPILEFIAEPYDSPVKRYLTLRMNEFTGNDLRWPGDDIGVLVTATYTEYDYVNNKYPSDIVLLANHISAVWLDNNKNTDIINKEQIEGHMIIKQTSDLLANDPMVNRIIESRSEIWLED